MIIDQAELQKSLRTLSREDMEAAVLYWEPACIAKRAEAEALHQRIRDFTGARWWKRVWWALLGRVP